MPIFNKLRIKDKKEYFYKNRKDFLIREFGISSRQVITFLAGTVIIIAAVAFLIKIYRNIADLNCGYNDNTWMVSGCITATLVGGVLYIAARQVKYHKEALDATEFLNALFASALGNGHTFCMMVTQPNMHIFYVDKGFQRTFPESLSLEQPSLDKVFSQYGVADAECSAIAQAVRNGKNEQVKLQIQIGSERKTSTVTVTIEPIPRPSGFCLIRGH